MGIETHTHNPLSLFPPWLPSSLASASLTHPPPPKPLTPSLPTLSAQLTPFSLFTSQALLRSRSGASLGHLHLGLHTANPTIPCPNQCLVSFPLMNLTCGSQAWVPPGEHHWALSHSPPQCLWLLSPPDTPNHVLTSCCLNLSGPSHFTFSSFSYSPWKMGIIMLTAMGGWTVETYKSLSTVLSMDQTNVNSSLLPRLLQPCSPSCGLSSRDKSDF